MRRQGVDNASRTEFARSRRGARDVERALSRGALARRWAPSGDGIPVLFQQSPSGWGILDQPPHFFQYSLMDNLRICGTQLPRVDRPPDLHANMNVFLFEYHVRQQLQGRRQFFFFFRRLFNDENGMLPGLYPYHAADEDGDDRRLWRHAEEHADGICPRLERIDRAWGRVGIGLDVARGERQRRAPRPQVRRDLSDEGHARGGVVLDVEKVFCGVGKRVEKGTVERDDFQVGTIERGKDGKGVGHAWVIGQEKR